MLYHDFDPATFREVPHTHADFEVPEVCKTTRYKCYAPGGRRRLSDDGPW